MFNTLPTRLAFWRSCAWIAGVAVVGLALADDVVGPRLWVQPTRLELRGTGDSQGLLVSVPADSGPSQNQRLLDVTRDARFSSTDERVLTVAPDGTVQAVGDGKAEVLVQFGGQTHPVAVVVQDAAHRSDSLKPF